MSSPQPLPFDPQAFNDGFADWIGVAESPCAHEALTSLASAASSVDLFEHDIDIINASSPLPPAPAETPDFDWTAFSGLFPPSDVSVFSTSSVETVQMPPSPVSDHTLVDLSFSNDGSDKIAFDDVYMGSFNPFEFTFTNPVPSSVTYPDCLSTFVDQVYGRPTSQHEVCAATPSTDAHGRLELDMEENENLFSFSFTDAAPPPPASQEQPAASDEEVVQKRKRDGSEEPATKRRRRQSTTRRFPCPQCDSVFARTHNLKVHVKSVHEGQRTNVCPKDGCDRSFSRKHDLTRHIQSKHTALGSPRRKIKGEDARDEEH